MQGTTASVRSDAAARVAALKDQRPEWALWLSLLQEVEEVANRESQVNHRRSPDAKRRGVSPPTAPLLTGCSLEFRVEEVQRLLRRLATKASALESAVSLRNYSPSREETCELIEAAVRQDHDAIGRVASARGLDGGALASVVHLAALPLLRSLGRELRDTIPEYWSHGYCPVCAAWPILAERRGLDRSRRLRCGRCGSEWEMEWLLCAYCAERDHQKLGSLVLEDAGDALKVETCASCGGYLKSFATLQAIPAFELLLRDLETIELDLAALQRGYRRPEGRGYRVESRVTSGKS
jgi:FdhE protein